MRATLVAVVLLLTGVLVVVPVVFTLGPVPPDADGLTLCIPGIGPLQRFNEGLEGEREELVHVHERVHAEQCRTWGALWFVGRLATARGRLAMEAEALCGEAALLVLRGGDRERVLARTVDILAADYFPHGEEVGRGDIVRAVTGACGAVAARAE